MSIKLHTDYFPELMTRVKQRKSLQFKIAKAIAFC